MQITITPADLENDAAFFQPFVGKRVIVETESQSDWMSSKQKLVGLLHEFKGNFYLLKQRNSSRGVRLTKIEAFKGFHATQYVKSLTTK